MAIDYKSKNAGESIVVDVVNISNVTSDETVSDISRRIVSSMVRPTPVEQAQLLAHGYNPDAGIALARFLNSNTTK